MRKASEWLYWAKDMAVKEAQERDPTTGYMHDTSFREKELLAAKCVELLEQLDHYHQLRMAFADCRKQIRDFAKKIVKGNHDTWCYVCNDMECEGQCQEDWGDVGLDGNGD